MTWKDNFHEALAVWLRGKGYDAALVTSFDEELYSTGYCETCYYEEMRAYVYYEDSNGDACTYNYYGTLAELMGELS